MSESSPITREYNTFYDNLNKALDKVLEEVKIEVKRQTVLRMIEGNLPLEKIAYYCDMPLEEVKKIMESQANLEAEPKKEDSNLSENGIVEEGILITSEQ